jgi:hypothetical protein
MFSGVCEAHNHLIKRCNWTQPDTTGFSLLEGGEGG